MPLIRAGGSKARCERLPEQPGVPSIPACHNLGVVKRSLCLRVRRRVFIQTRPRSLRVISSIKVREVTGGHSAIAGFTQSQGIVCPKLRQHTRGGSASNCSARRGFVVPDICGNGHLKGHDHLESIAPISPSYVFVITEEGVIGNEKQIPDYRTS